MISPKSSGKPKAKRLRAPFAIRRVVGESMLPTLTPGQLVLVRQWYTRPQIGRIVVIEHNGLQKIKRISNMRKHEVYVTGDNPGQSTDSREFGWIANKSVVGIIA